MASAKKIDWEKIRTEYITTKRSYRDLAAKYDMSRRTIECKAKKEDWPRLRGEYKGNIVADSVAVYELQAAQTTAAVMVDIQKAITKLSKIVDKAIDMQAESQDPDVNKVYKLASTVKCLAEAHRNAFDLPTYAERQQAEIAARRLQLESMKANQEKDKNAPKEVRLSFDGGSDPEWAK